MRPIDAYVRQQISPIGSDNGLIIHCRNQWRLMANDTPKNTFPLNENVFEIQKFSFRKMCWPIESRAPSQYKDRLIYVWRFPC